jgi:hypothetical protein
MNRVKTGASNFQRYRIVQLRGDVYWQTIGHKPLTAQPIPLPPLPNRLRGFWYDRHPTVYMFDSGDVVAGAAVRALTAEFTYTTPPSRYALVASCLAEARNSSPTACNNEAIGEITVLPKVNQVLTTAGPDIQRAVVPAGAAAFVATNTLLPSGLLLSGDRLSYQDKTNNTAAGSNIIFRGSAWIIEFDV